MSDYTSLKTERAELQGQLRLLKKQLEEALEENNCLRAGENSLSAVSTLTDEITMTMIFYVIVAPLTPHCICGVCVGSIVYCGVVNDSVNHFMLVCPAVSLLSSCVVFLS